MKVFVIFVMLLLAACSEKKEPTVEKKSEGQVVHWGYEAEDGPDKWGAMDPEWILCAEGLSQSPIDLTNSKVIDLPEVVIDVLSGKEVELVNQAGVISELDNGHTIQINARTGEKMTVGDMTYSLIQFHFHAPSEHSVNGKHYPMEMHFVHQAKNGSLAVVGVFIEEGAHNPGIEPFWKQLGNDPGTATSVKIPADFADHIFSGSPGAVYHYDGSLTTPPCSEGVQWYIRKKTTQLSKKQIEAFKAVYDHNNRPIQAINERTVYLDKDPSLIIK